MKVDLREQSRAYSVPIWRGGNACFCRLYFSSGKRILIIDEGYVTWHEVYPGETEDIMDERNKLTALKDSDPKEYLTAINFWAVERIQCLKDDGWRKAVRSCCQVSFSQNYK